MMSSAFARTRGFWAVMARAVLIGALSGTAAVAFLTVERWLVGWLWGDDLPTGAFELGWVAVAVILVGAVIVGVHRRWSRLEPPDPNFVDEVIHGRAVPRTSLHLVLLGLTSLAGGASLGPEAPVATAGAGLGTAIGARQASDAGAADLTVSGISGALGALLTLPIAGPLLALEVQDHPRGDRYARLFPALVAATVSLLVAYPVLGAPFLGLFAQTQPPLTLEAVLWAAVIGLAGAGVGVVAVLAIGVAGALFTRIPHAVARAVAGGLGLAGLGALLPLTLLSGQEQLPVVLDQADSLGLGLLAATLAGKVLALAVSLRCGYFGGPIFPLLFLGAVTGIIVHELVPGVPVSVAVPAAAAGTTIALLGMPFTVLVFLLIVFSPDGGGPVAAGLLTFGFVVFTVAARIVRCHGPNSLAKPLRAPIVR